METEICTEAGIHPRQLLCSGRYGATPLNHASVEKQKQAAGYGW
jgi:hypothetical protein